MPYSEKWRLPENERWLYERRKGQVVGLQWAIRWAEQKIAKIERSNKNLLANRAAPEPKAPCEEGLWDL